MQRVESGMRSSDNKRFFIPPLDFPLVAQSGTTTDAFICFRLLLLVLVLFYLKLETEQGTRVGSETAEKARALLPRAVPTVLSHYSSKLPG